MKDDVKNYLKTVPEESKGRLQTIRKYILEYNDNIEEGISYGVLVYSIGKKKFHVGGFKSHIGLYPGPQFIKNNSHLVQTLKTSKGTIQVPHEHPIPFALIDKMIAHLL